MPAPSGAIVAFDFDGTLTTRDSFMMFLAWRVMAPRYLGGLGRLLPAVAAYLGDHDRGRLKAAAVREFLRGLPRNVLEAEAQAFARSTSARLLRPDALETWRQWGVRGATRVIVTASPEVTIAPFAHVLGADTLIGTRLKFDAEDRVEGGLEGENCRADEKVRRLREWFGPDVRLAAAYGDTSGDHAMLGIADEQGYRVFKQKP